MTLSPSKLITCLLLFAYGNIQAQSGSKDCKQVSQGVFYYYAKDNNYIYTRYDNIQREVNRETGDTSVWKIIWKGNCNYTLTHISGSKSVEALERSFNSPFEMDVKILSVTPGYFVYSAALIKPKKGAPVTDTLWSVDHPEKLITSNRKEPEFPGGLQAWADYLMGYRQKRDFKLDESKKEGTCLVQFLVNEDGSVSDVKALTMKGTKIGKFAVEAIKNSPRWIPGSVDGKPAKLPKIQPVQLNFIEGAEL